MVNGIVKGSFCLKGLSGDINMINNELYKREYKLKRIYPFIYSEIRPATQTEIILHNYDKAESLFISVFPILIIAKIVYFFKKSVGGNDE